MNICPIPLIIAVLSILSPIVVLIGTFLILYADHNKVKTDSLFGINKAASFLSNNVPIASIIRHEKLYFPHNMKMKVLYIIGIILLIIGTLIGVFAGVFALILAIN